MDEHRSAAVRRAVARSGAVVLAVFGLVAVLTTVTAVTSRAASAAVDPPASEVRVEGPVRIEVADGGVLTLHDGRRYLDTLELLPRGEGAVLVNDLGIEDYVAGIAEMPSRWPMEALQAQAIAARTYAWYSIELGTFDGYDVCATVACQVFRGADTFLDSGDGDRWRAAVDATAGEVLLTDDGAPILARYFSTSGGRTFANQDVFPSSGARDYLVAIDDPADAVSPYHRWTATFTREEFDDILGRGDTLAGATPVATVERLGDVDDQGASIRVTGQDGMAVEVGAVVLREFVSRIARERYPDRFPGARADGLRPLPSTIPSSRYEVEVTDDEVVFHGRGWGHGVGLGQYGAKGRAEQGELAADILRTYYGGIGPTRSDRLPERIRVGIDVPAELTVSGDRAVSIVAEGDTVVPLALGTWSFIRDGSGWRVVAPAGHDDALEVGPTRRAAAALAVEDAVTVEAEVNKAALRRLEVRDDTGALVIDRDLGVADAGVHAATWRFTDADGAPVPPGAYRLVLLAEDGTGTVGGEPLDIAIDEEATTRAGSEPDGSGVAAMAPLVLLALIALVALVTVILATRKART